MPMLDENQLIEVLCTYLEKEGYIIEQKLNTNQQGIDIIASSKAKREKLYIEAKGGTSSRMGSPRHGKQYTSSQIFDRVAKGVYTSIKTVSDLGKNEVSCLAVPDDSRFIQHLVPIRKQLQKLHIKTFLVSSKGVITDVI